MTFDYRDVLLKAASRVEQEGMWYQGWFWPDMEATAQEALSRGLPACAIGSLILAAEELNIVPAISEDARHELGETIASQLIGHWNDTPGRTAHEVAEAMRKAAA